MRVAIDSCLSAQMTEREGARARERDRERESESESESERERESEREGTFFETVKIDSLFRRFLLPPKTK
jgi:hypothetical protein